MAAVIFDFDGTIADSFDYVVGFLASAAGEDLTADQRQQLRGRSMAAIGRRLGLSWVRLLRLFFKGRRDMHQAINHIEPFDDMTDTIQKLHAEGHELFVVSHNTVANIHAFLHHYDLHTYFLQIYGGVGLFGKAPVLRKVLKEQNLEKADALYVGDEIRDVQAAQSIDLRIIAVTWGFARPSDLRDLKPTAVADQPEDLIKILEEL
jgi:phosphoglycolate phosphatase-like HAD superfamily hydrolase